MTIDQVLAGQDPGPEARKIKKFLQDYHRLAEFEAAMRAEGRFSAYSEAEVETFPDRDVAEVLEWLLKKSG